MILIDLQKAFDTNHEILSKKLEATGFLDQCMQWFWSYPQYQHRDVKENWKVTKQGFWKFVWLVCWQ